MISVPSHPRRLSGSKAFYACLVILGFCACTSQRKVIDKPSRPIPPIETEENEQVPQFDPVEEKVIMVPRDAIIIDTVEWIDDKTPPIITDNDLEQPKPKKSGPLNVAILMPFDAANARLFSEQLDPQLNRFIQYYAGMQIAMTEMAEKKLPINVQTFDALAVTNSFPAITQKAGVKEADVVVGLYDKKEIQTMASFCLKNEKMLVSPWLPSFTPNIENPYFIQLYSGLNAHAEAITTFIREEMPDKKVFVVARDKEVEKNRIHLFTNSAMINVESLIINDSTPDLINTNLFDLMQDSTGTIFILPYYSRADESFVNAFMRKVHADKELREATIFGFPQWLGFNNLNANYMESLSLHLSVSSFIDVNNQEYDPFRATFFNRYHTVPDINAFLGYDLMQWLAFSLTEGGQEGLIGQLDAAQFGIASGFDIRPIYKSNADASAEMLVPSYYENARIRIIRYLNHDFQLVK